MKPAITFFHPTFQTMIVFGLLVSCSIKPAKIYYGTDGCQFCKMTIVDRQHAAQLITDKGKAYKFDAIECMVNRLHSMENSSIGMVLVNDFEQPGLLINAKSATYLVSNQIPSPMGAFLSAFGTKAKAIVASREKSGQLYSWEELMHQFNQPENASKPDM
ncbi:MAG: nitrous oxide reductase accessory protein NosL [Cyclobacteriaceae bacterium]